MMFLVTLFYIVLLLSVPGEGFLSISQCPTKRTYSSQRVQANNKCYEFILNQRKDWTHAQLDCRKKGGNLVTIETSAEEHLIEQFLKNYNYHQKGVWIGLNDIYQEGTFVWDSGKPVNFTRWGSGQPDDFKYNQHQDCVLLYVPHHYEQHNGILYATINGTPGWHDQACHDGYGVREDEGWICEYEVSQQSTPTPQNQHVTIPIGQTVNPMAVYNCPSQFTYPGQRKVIGNKCYEFILFNPADWVHAREDCHKKGGYLVTIENIQDEKLLSHYIQSTQYHGKGVWIGLNDLQNEGQFVWDSGKAVDFIHWEPGQPDDNQIQQQQDCVLLYPPREDSQDSPGWHDQLCHDIDFPVHSQFFYEDNGWICEYYIQSQVSTDQPVTDSKSQQTSKSNVEQSQTSVITSSESPTISMIQQVANNSILYNTGSQEVTTSSLTTTNPTNSYSCPFQTTYPGNQTVIGNKCYEFILFHTVDWVQARDDCHKKGGYLVTIENIQDEKLLSHYIQSTQYHGKGVWIGLNDLQNEGRFTWDSGRAPEFIHWESGQPDDQQQQQNCVLFIPPNDETTLTSPGWCDQICSDKNEWICEYCKYKF